MPGASRELRVSITLPLITKMADEILNADQSPRLPLSNSERVALLKSKLQAVRTSRERFVPVADYLVKKSVWIFGGDGWGHDTAMAVLIMFRNW